MKKIISTLAFALLLFPFISFGQKTTTLAQDTGSAAIPAAVKVKSPVIKKDTIIPGRSENPANAFIFQNNIGENRNKYPSDTLKTGIKE